MTPQAEATALALREETGVALGNPAYEALCTRIGHVLAQADPEFDWAEWARLTNAGDLACPANMLLAGWQYRVQPGSDPRTVHWWSNTIYPSRAKAQEYVDNPRWVRPVYARLTSEENAT